MSEISNVIEVKFHGARLANVDAIYRLDQEQFLQFSDIELPPTYRVDFGRTEDGDTISMIGDENGVQIPDELLVDAGKLHVWIWLNTGTYGGKTCYHAIMRKKIRGDVTDYVPTPGERQQIDTFLEIMNREATKAEEEAGNAETSAGNAERDALKAEGFSIGTQDGVPVESGSPYFMNNASFFASVAGQAASNAGWVHFYIDGDGYLHYVKTENCDLDFYIDNNGYLHVTNGEA